MSTIIAQNFITPNGDSINPSGTVITFAGAAAPGGYLECDGASVSSISYPELFNAIGYIYGGSGDDFNLPDLRGQHLRGANNAGQVGEELDATYIRTAMNDWSDGDGSSSNTDQFVGQAYANADDVQGPTTVPGTTYNGNGGGFGGVLYDNISLGGQNNSTVQIHTSFQ